VFHLSIERNCVTSPNRLVGRELHRKLPVISNSLSALWHRPQSPVGDQASPSVGSQRHCHGRRHVHPRHGYAGRKENAAVRPLFPVARHSSTSPVKKLRSGVTITRFPTDIVSLHRHRWSDVGAYRYWHDIGLVPLRFQDARTAGMPAPD